MLYASSRCNNYVTCIDLEDQQKLRVLATERLTEPDSCYVEGNISSESALRGIRLSAFIPCDTLCGHPSEGSFDVCNWTGDSMHYCRFRHGLLCCFIFTLDPRHLAPAA